MPSESDPWRNGLRNFRWRRTVKTMRTATSAVISSIELYDIIYPYPSNMQIYMQVIINQTYI